MISKALCFESGGLSKNTKFKMHTYNDAKLIVTLKEDISQTKEEKKRELCGMESSHNSRIPIFLFKKKKTSKKKTDNTVPLFPIKPSI